MWSILLSIALALVGFFLMFIILLQRGRGGGLAGAFGGLGGQSAFGTKAGDVFTKITIVVAVFWVLLSGLTGIAMWSESERRFKGGSDVPAKVSAPEDGDDVFLPPSDIDAGNADGGLDGGAAGESNKPDESDDDKNNPDSSAKDTSQDNKPPG